MSAYFGTEAQQRLQQKSDRLTPWIMDTPGACLTGRLIASDDPDRLGWDVIRQHLAEDGAFGFRWTNQDRLANIKQQLVGTGASIFGWDGFHGDADALRPAISAPLAQALPNELSVEKAEAAGLGEMQAFLAQHAITPLSAAVLGGQNCKATSVLIRDVAGTVVACGFVGMMQNRHSALQSHAWAGLIATNPDRRGLGLGRRITCELIRAAFDDLGATHVMAFAAPDNLASKAMLSGCGLRSVEPASYVATLADKRPTR